MIFAQILARAASFLTAGTNGFDDNGYSSGSYGEITGDPALLRSYGATVITIAHFGGVDEIALTVAGDQTSWIGSGTLSIDGTDYAVSAASSGPAYFSGSDRTDIRWNEPTNPFTVGNTYTIRFV